LLEKDLTRVGGDIGTSESGVDAVLTAFGGAALYGGTAETSGFMNGDGKGALFDGGTVNIGPQLRAGTALELQLTISLRELLLDPVVALICN